MNEEVNKQAATEKENTVQERTVDADGFEHAVTYDDTGRVVSDQKFDTNGNVIGEGIYENGEFKGSKLYFTDNEGFSHVAVKDELDRPVSGQKFDKDGNLVGEGIYENGEFKGSKQYFTDNEGFSHVAVKDALNHPLSDQKFDKDGNLIGEGIYENGEFKGSKRYFADNEGFAHIAVMDENDRPLSDRKFDKDGNLIGEGIYENGEFAGHREYTVKDGVEEVVEYDANGNVRNPAPQNTAEENSIENGDAQSDVNENQEEDVCSVENADEQETERGLDEPNCFQQGQNLKQWLNYFSMEGSRAKPPYASPFEKVTGCHNDTEYNAAVLDLENGNRIVNSSKRLDLLIRRTGPEKVEPTFAECMTLVRLGQQKGWTSARITGSKEFQKQMYLACRALGMPTKDFIPTEEMLKEGAEIESVYNNKSKILPQSKEDAEAQKPQVREPTLAERCYDLDDRFSSLEKIRKAQPARPKTAEDPDPELANFDTIRKAEQKGICPVTGITVPREDGGNKKTSSRSKSRFGRQVDEKPLSDNISRAHAQTVQALKGLQKAEKNQKDALLTSARQNQRDEWRAQLQAVAQKESAGEQLSKDELHVKAMADKYQIKSNPAEEPEHPRPIDRADFSKDTEKNLRKQEKSAEIRTIFTASVVCRENAANIGAMLNGEKNAAPLSAEELIIRGNAQLKQETAAKPPVSELVKKVGENNAFTKTKSAENAQKYRDLTGHAIPRRRMNQLEERVAAVKKNNSR